MSTPLVIVGAGGFSRETAEAVRCLNRVDPTWNLVCFADDDRRLWGSSVDGTQVRGPVADVVQHHPDAQVVVCTGRPDNYFSRPGLVARLGLPQQRYATIVHPTASVAVATTIGLGSVVLAGVVVTAAASIGSHVAVMPGCIITHDDVIGDYATLASGVRLGGSVQIGTGAYIGAGALVREELTVGDWAMIGMGSLLTRSVPAEEQWFGSPARFQRLVEIPAALRAVIGPSEATSQAGEGP